MSPFAASTPSRGQPGCWHHTWAKNVAQSHFLLDLRVNEISSQYGYPSFWSWRRLFYTCVFVDMHFSYLMIFDLVAAFDVGPCHFILRFKLTSTKPISPTNGQLQSHFCFEIARLRPPSYQSIHPRSLQDAERRLSGSRLGRNVTYRFGGRGDEEFFQLVRANGRVCRYRVLLTGMDCRKSRRRHSRIRADPPTGRALNGAVGAEHGGRAKGRASGNRLR